MTKIKLLLAYSFILITSAVFGQVTIPYFDDFEGANAGWSVDSVAGSTWELGLPSTAPCNTVHSGVNGWDVDLLNLYLPNSESYLISPAFDFSVVGAFNSVLSFWQNRSTEVGADGVRIDYSTNGGVSWNVLGTTTSGTNWYNDGGISSSSLSAWDGISGGWIKSSYPLAIFNGSSSVMFRFAFTSDFSVDDAGFTMDDFSISPPAAIDAGVTAILDPNSNWPANSTSPINIVIYNYGQNSLTSIPIEVFVNGGPAISYTWTGNLAPGISDTVVVGSMVVPMGLYTICAHTGLINDGDVTNDTLCNSIFGSTATFTVSVFDSLGFTTCVNPPIQDQFYVVGTASTLNDGDTVNINLAFGDGSDTTVTTTVFGGSYFVLIFHSYLFNGQFSVQAIASSTTGLTDTATSYNQLVIADTCGNISGNVYADLNNNCLFDGADYELSNIPVHLMQGTNIVSTYYTTSTGDYFFVVPTATVYDIAIDTTYAGNNTYCPASGKITGVSDPSPGNDFAIIPDNNFELEPYMNPFIIRANANSLLFLHVQNHFLTPVSGSLKLVMDTNLLQVVSSVPAISSVNGDTLIWNFSNISNFNANSFYANLYVQPKTSLVLGNTICFTAIAEPLANDYDSTNNTKVICGVVSNSYDPNTKTVEPAGTGAGGNIAPETSSFTYTVNFQNTGSSVAYNVFILDTIDNNLDITSLHILQSSHLVTTQIIASNVVKFTFDNIMLPDSTTDEPGSHGFVSYTIAPKTGLADGTQIHNTGYIYFDFNAAIATNTVTNTIDYTLGIADNYSNPGHFILYPNPASDHINILLNEKVNGTLTMTDAYGKTVLVQKAQMGMQQVNVKNLANGFYSLTLKSEKYIISEKILISR